MNRKLYLCDPRKNTDCKKTMCITNCMKGDEYCYLTCSPECAITDGNGMPIEYKDWMRDVIEKTLQGQITKAIDRHVLDQLGITGVTR